MDYCGPRGIPWDEFQRWPKVSRDAAVLWERQERERCSSCGTHPGDWDPARGGHERAFVATLLGCAGCAAMENRRDDLEKKRGPGQTIGLRRQVRRSW